MELVVVMALLALALTIAVPSLRAPAGAVRLEPLAALVSADLRRAHAAAMTRGSPVAFAVDPARHGYRLEGLDRAVALPAAAGLTVAGDSRSLKAAAAGRIVFFPDGTSTGGRVTLSDGGGRAVAIGVKWLTGAVEAEDQPR
jgi:general secretion pathway protein H